MRQANHPAEGLDHHVLRQLYGYWEQQRAGRLAPRRADIDPARLGTAMGWVTLVDVLDDGTRFQARVVGGNLARLIGQDDRHLAPEDFDDPELTELGRTDMSSAVGLRQPLRVFRDLRTRRRHYRFESLLLPLSEDGEKVTQLLVTAIPPLGG